MTLSVGRRGRNCGAAFVDDRPVTPSKDAQGNVLVPLKKSENVDPDDEDELSRRCGRSGGRRGWMRSDWD